MTDARAPAPSALVWGLLALCCGIEALLWASDAGYLGAARWRALAYQNGAFWPGLVYDWRPNYAAQPWLMFVSYAFLHGGLGHLLGNMLTLVMLGPPVQARVGTWGFLGIYGAAMVGGAAGYAVFGPDAQPVVGASGALFGLAGALICLDWVARQRIWQTLALCLFLVALNVVLALTLDGGLAWQTHLAGFGVGWAIAVVLARWHAD